MRSVQTLVSCPYALEHIWALCHIPGIEMCLLAQMVDWESAVWFALEGHAPVVRIELSSSDPAG